MKDTVIDKDCFTVVPTIPDESIDVVITDPPYPNGMKLFADTIIDGYAMIYYACKKVKNYVIFFWSPNNVPPPPRGWYEVARHVWHKPDCRTITHYEVIVVWSRNYKRQTSRVWSIPILDYRSLKDWKPHPTQKPVRLLRYVLDLYTNPGDVVLDPFAGTGTTAVACKQTGRHYIAIENNPEYAAITKERLQTANKTGAEEQPATDPEQPLEADADPAQQEKHRRGTRAPKRD
jgi:adenine-specific DNA-methyltransferase